MASVEIATDVDEKAVSRLKECIASLDPLYPDTLEKLMEGCFDFDSGGSIRLSQLGAVNITAAASAASELLTKMEKLGISEGKDSRLYYNVSLLFEVGGALEQALVMSLKSADLKPHDVKKSWNVALLYDTLHKKCEAARWYRRTIDIDPTFIRAQTNLAFLYWKCGYYKLAYQEYKTVVMFTGNNQENDDRPLRVARRMVKYLEKKIELFGDRDEDISSYNDLHIDDNN